MDLQFCLLEQQFSLAILVIKLPEMFQSKAFSQILRRAQMPVQEIVLLRRLTGRGEAWPYGGWPDARRRLRTWAQWRVLRANMAEREKPWQEKLGVNRNVVILFRNLK